MQKVALKLFDPYKGAIKKITTNSPVKSEFTSFSMGWPVIFIAKRGPWNFFEVWRGGGGENFCDIFFFCISPPYKCLWTVPYTIIHIQIPPTGYVGLILRNTAVATQVAVLLRVLWGYSDAPVTKGWEAVVHVVAAEYPHGTLNGTVTCSSHSGVV